jgi:hypothetical protein
MIRDTDGLQRHFQGVLAYWMDENAKYPGLDTYVCQILILLSFWEVNDLQTPLDDEEDNSTALATWVLAMLKENTDKIINAQIEKQIKQTGKMDLGDDNNDDDAGVDTSEEGLRKKAKAEQEVLIKVIQEKIEEMDLDGQLV